MKCSSVVPWRGRRSGTVCALTTQNYAGVETASRPAIVPLTFSARIPARWEQPVSLAKLYLHNTLSVGTTVIRAILRGSNRLKHAVDVTAFAVTLLLKTWCLTARLSDFDLASLKLGSFVHLLTNYCQNKLPTKSEEQLENLERISSWLKFLSYSSRLVDLCDSFDITNGCAATLAGLKPLWRLLVPPVLFPTFLECSTALN